MTQKLKGIVGAVSQAGGPQGQARGSKAWLEAPKAWLETWLEAHKAWLDAPKAWLEAPKRSSEDLPSGDLEAWPLRPGPRGLAPMAPMALKAWFKLPKA